MKIVLMISMILAFISIVVVNIYELIETTKYYKRLNEYHNACMKELLKGTGKNEI